MTSIVPVEVRLAEGVAVRGQEHSGTGPPVVLLHEPDRDLDAWGPLAPWIAGKGFKVIALDLPGHGLSDGDAVDWEPLLNDALTEITRQFGPIAVAAAGDSCRLLPRLGPDENIPVQVLISPGPIDPDVLKLSGWAIRMVLCGPADADAHAAAKQAYDGLRGEKLLISGGDDEQGTRLVIAHRHLAEELVMWFRRYLTPYHLRWIKQITEAGPSNKPKEQ